MRPKSRGSTKRTVLRRVVALLAILLIVAAMWYLAKRSTTNSPVLPPSTIPPSTSTSSAARKMPLALLLSKVRLFMMVHNVSLTDAPAPAPVPTLASDTPASRAASHETAQYRQQCITNLDATPDSVLMYHFNASAQGELARFNAEAERELLDDGYAEHIAHSKEFWDPMHALRRGYGTEGSIFVVLPFSPTSDDVYRVSPFPASPTAAASAEANTPPVQAYVHAGCASTVRSVYQHARWPVAVNVATPQFLFTRLTDGGANRTVERIIRCMPPEYAAPSVEHSEGFVYKDNMRARSVVIPLPPGRPYTEATGATASTSSLFSSSHAMRFALMQLYLGESYVLFTNPGVVLAPGWDWTTKLLYLQLPERGRAVISTQAMTVMPVLAEAYISVLRQSSKDVDVGLPLSTDTATVPLRALKETVDSDLPTLLRLVAPTWLHPYMTKADVGRGGGGAEVASPSVSDDASSSATRKALRALFDRDAAAAQSATPFRLTSTSLSPSLVLEVISRQGPALFALPTLCTTSDDGDWLAGAHSIDKQKLECAWLRAHHVRLAQTMANRLEEWAFVNVAAVTRTAESSRRADVPLVDVSTSMIGRKSRSLRELRYLRPGAPASSTASSSRGAPSALPVAGDMWSLSQVYQGRTSHDVPYIAELVGSTDFLFARAEAFAAVLVEDRLQFGPGKPEPPGELVRLDPFLGQLTRGEEDFYVSAKLWTNGWNLFAPTEALAFAAPRGERAAAQGRDAQPNATQHADADAGDKKNPNKDAPSFLSELRERTAGRLTRFFSCEASLSQSCASALDGAAYTPGTTRPLREYLKWTNVHISG